MHLYMTHLDFLYVAIIGVKRKDVSVATTSHVIGARVGRTASDVTDAGTLVDVTLPSKRYAVTCTQNGVHVS